MTYKVFIEPSALRDATEAAAYIRSTTSPAAAAKWLDKLEAAIADLNSHPQRFRVIDEQKFFAIELRQFRHFSHRVIFHVNDESATVRVLRIYHGYRDALRPKD
ncbi:MAG: type II toxin-antitoxin system RelE/ParE family toxin [Chthonomonas sp.]|nr:type II toxin-antitoxin system RelE/ParE family toxin [Chthonomonas sp.]